MKLIPLTNSITEFALIDDEDYERVIQYKWYLVISKSGQKYAQAKLGIKHTSSLHRFIMKCRRYDNRLIDHKDSNGLNCQKYNLRDCSILQNSYNFNTYLTNTSGYSGIWWEKKYKKWYVYITINKIRKFLGYFLTLEEAFIARIKAELQYHKEFASCWQWLPGLSASYSPAPLIFEKFNNSILLLN